MYPKYTPCSMRLTVEKSCLSKPRMFGGQIGLVRTPVLSAELTYIIGGREGSIQIPVLLTTRM